MFDIGFTELLVIAVVALLVLGPERLPKAARFAGLWVRRGRAQWASVRSELERELAADELKRSLRETEDAMRDIDASVDRKSVVSGKGVSVRVDLGGRRIIKKKKPVQHKILKHTINRS